MSIFEDIELAVLHAVRNTNERPGYTLRETAKEGIMTACTDLAINLHWEQMAALVNESTDEHRKEAIKEMGRYDEREQTLDNFAYELCVAYATTVLNEIPI